MHDDPKNYTSQGFWDKVNAIAKAAGQEVVEKSLATLLYRQRFTNARLGKDFDLRRIGLSDRPVGYDP